MTSLNSPHAFHEGQTVYDARKRRRGIVVSPPLPGRWIWLDHPDDRGNPLRQWPTLLGDIQPVGD